MYFHERVARELQTLYICIFYIKLMILVKYLLDNYFRSRAVTYVLIKLNAATS